MEYRLSFSAYQRAFIRPLRTARGEWLVRKGFIVRVEGPKGFGYGEVAPIPEFGTETVEAALAYLNQVSGKAGVPSSAMVPDVETLPCCAFGISSAMLPIERVSRRDYKLAALLPAGKKALGVAKAKIADGYTSFKWKIGVEPAKIEQALLIKLLEYFPSGTQLRLDANGGLSEADMEEWLKILSCYLQQIDYLEQPLPVGREDVMARYASKFKVPISLDESLHGVVGNKWLKAGVWQGPLVIKPALMGDCSVLVKRLRPIAAQVVLSSVFETAIGLENTLQIADQLAGLCRPIGFDTPGAFSDSLNSLKTGPVISIRERDSLNPSAIWNSSLK